MTFALEDGLKIGECDDCGRKDVELYEDTGRCEYCDSEWVRCDICKTDEHRDSLCRHLNEDPDGEFYGSGYDPDGNEHVKKSLFRLFDLMPGGFATDLGMAIRGRKFYTYLIAPLIGSGGLLELHGMPTREGMRDCFGWGDYMLRIGQSDDAEECSMAYGWLSSLYLRKTEKANRTTLRWIREYIEVASKESR